MSRVENKRILRLIARRWAKGVLQHGGLSDAFTDSGLTDDEVEEIQQEVDRICERITSESAAPDTGRLVNEYFEP